MIRTQVQLPEPLYREVQRVALEQDWSIAEVIRRGAEAVSRTYPPLKGPAQKVWSLPPPIRSRLLLVESGALADAIRGESEPSLP